MTFPRPLRQDAGPMRFSVDGAFDALARFVVRFRWAVVAFWIAAAVITSGALPSLGSKVNNNNSAFLRSNAPSVKAANLASPVIGGTASGRIASVTIVAARSGQLTGADLRAVARVASQSLHVDHVLSVRELGVSADGEAVAIRARARFSPNDITKDEAIVNGLQDTFTSAHPPPGLQLHLAGQVATAVANNKSSNKSSNKIQQFSILLIIVLLLLVFRSIPAAIVTLIPSALALVISMRLIGGLGSSGLKISAITQVLLIILLLGAGTDYGLFLVFRVREELRAGRDPHDAVRHALVRVGESISASAGTVILALLTLLLASFGIYHDLGAPLAVGMAVMLAIGLTLLPALLAILGRKAFWPSKIEPGTQREGWWGRIAGRIVQHPKTTLAIGVAVFLGLAAAALGYHNGGFGGATKAPAGSSAAAGNAALAKHFPQSSSNPGNLVMAYPRPVWTNARAIETAQRVLRASGDFKELQGPLDPNGTALTPAQFSALYARLGPPHRLPVSRPAGAHVPPALYNAYRASAVFVSPDGRTIQFEATLVAGAQDSTGGMRATPKIRAIVTRAANASGASQNGVAGEAAATYDISTTANNDLIKIIPIAVLAIGLLLALVLRSLVAPLYLIFSVVLSYLAALGVATLAFIDIGGDNGIVFILPFLMFIFLLALGEDYNILVMTRIREEAKQLPLREAVVKAIGRTGPTVTSAGLILGGTFAVFAAVGGGGSGGGQLRAIGVGLAAGILMDTFLVRTLLVPSTVILLGRVNWWPSAMGRGRRISARGLRPADARETP
jgi:putative drug exporter of the RND superfamily